MRVITTATALWRTLLVAGIISMPFVASGADLPADAAGVHRDVVFTE